VPSTRDLKQRINSVRGTRKITRAMELVASAKLRRAQESIERLRPYAVSMRRLMAQAARQSGNVSGLPLLEERGELKRAVVLAVTGDRGLAGAFNVNVLRRGYAVAEELQVAGAEVSYVVVGKKGAGTLRFRGMTIDRSFEGITAAPTFSDAEQVAQYLVEEFIEGRLDKVIMVYNAFESVITQKVTQEQMLPIERRIIEDDDDDPDTEPTFSKALAFFEPDAKDFLLKLLPTWVNTQIYRALLESAAAEHAARRTAMRNATDNAGILIDQLTLKMNRARQAAITQEILEVVAGADALT
jgi:F-type H+-transporting ATPase subunit gamma